MLRRLNILRNNQSLGLFVSNWATKEQPLLHLPLLLPNQLSLLNNLILSLDIAVCFSQLDHRKLSLSLPVLVQKHAWRQPHLNVANFYGHVRRKVLAVYLDGRQVEGVVAPHLKDSIIC